MSLSRLSVSVSKTSKKKEQNNQFVGFKEEKHLFGHEKKSKLRSILSVLEIATP